MTRQAGTKAESQREAETDRDSNLSGRQSGQTETRCRASARTAMPIDTGLRSVTPDFPDLIPGEPPTKIPYRRSKRIKVMWTFQTKE